MMVVAVVLHWTSAFFFATAVLLYYRLSPSCSKRDTDSPPHYSWIFSEFFYTDVVCSVSCIGRRMSPYY